VSFDPLAPTSTWAFQRKDKREINVPIDSRLSVSTAEAAVWAATQGVGATRVLHYQCAEALHQRSLRTILTGFEPPPLPIHLLHAGRGTLPSKMRLFLDFATTRLRERLSAL
jgi:DNA-binding transcriptional LysR family regulator